MPNFIDKILSEALNQKWSGAQNDVIDLNNGWVLKTAKSGKGMKKHIQPFLKFPELFPKVTQYNDKEATIEKLNTTKAEQSYYQLYNEIIDEFEDYDYIDDIAIANHVDLDYLKTKPYILAGTKNAVINKWLTFILKINKSIKNVDLHIGNIGMDKDGQLKLIDW